MATTVKRFSSKTLVAVRGTLPDLTTEENDYVDVGVWDVSTLKTKRLRFVATDENLNAKVLGSLDGGTTYTETVEAEFAVDVGTPVVKTITDYVTDLKVQAKPKVNDTHGTLATQLVGVSF